jgi:hypothetical protein
VDVPLWRTVAGARLRPEALRSLLGGRNIADISALRLDELRSFAAGLPAVRRTNRLPSPQA